MSDRVLFTSGAIEFYEGGEIRVSSGYLSDNWKYTWRVFGGLVYLRAVNAVTGQTDEVQVATNYVQEAYAAYLARLITEDHDEGNFSPSSGSDAEIP